MDYWLIALPVVALVVVLLLRVGSRKGAPEPVPEPPRCICCNQAEAVTYMPHLVSRRQDHVFNSQATRSFGVPPPPVVGQDFTRGALLCTNCATVCTRELDAFANGQYSQIVDVIAQHSRAAAVFEGTGMVASARKSLGLKARREPKPQSESVPSDSLD